MGESLGECSEGGEGENGIVGNWNQGGVLWHVENHCRGEHLCVRGTWGSRGSGGGIRCTGAEFPGHDLDPLQLPGHDLDPLRFGYACRRVLPTVELLGQEEGGVARALQRLGRKQAWRKAGREDGRRE
jgi:hypothetical protein